MFEKSPATNSTFATGLASFSEYSFEVKESAVLRMNIWAEKPAHLKSAKHSCLCWCFSPTNERRKKQVNFILALAGVPSKLAESLPLFLCWCFHQQRQNTNKNNLIN